MEECEDQLPGGGLGGAVRVGTTVRRIAGPWTPTIHALLSHLVDAGLDGIPRPMGTDQEGREVLSLIEGQTVYSTRGAEDQEWPAWAYADELLVEAGQWLGRYHDAVRSFRPQGPRWRSGARELRPDEIVCHFDFRAANVVVQGIDKISGLGTPNLVGVVDWDTAGPGRPLWDLALAAWNWVPLWHVPDRQNAEVARRLRLLVSAYGSFSPYEVLGAVPDRLDAAGETTVAMAAAGDEAMRRLIDERPSGDEVPSPPTLRDRLPGLFLELGRGD